MDGFLGFGQPLLGLLRREPVTQRDGREDLLLDLLEPHAGDAGGVDALTECVADYRFHLGLSNSKLFGGAISRAMRTHSATPSGLGTR